MGNNRKDGNYVKILYELWFSVYKLEVNFLKPEWTWLALAGYFFSTKKSCCVDVVAGEHCNAECIVHFGHSCLSIVEKIPVFYVFEKSPLNIDSVEREIELLLKQNEQPLNKLIVLYDVCYFYLYGNI